VNKLPENIVW